MNALVAENVCRSYGEREVLKNFSFSLEEGKMVALMGASGSGKSTFLHIAAGLLSLESGSVYVGETCVNTLSDSESARFRRQSVGVVFQAFNLLNEKTVRENILMPLKLDGRDKTPQALARLKELSSRLGLESSLDKKPEQLSGGEQQRVAIARALIHEPKLLLADEPTGNLDAKASQEFCKLLKELKETEKSAILLVTHDPLVAACAEKVYFLRDGRIVSSCDTNGDASLISKAYLSC